MTPSLTITHSCKQRQKTLLIPSDLSKYRLFVTAGASQANQKAQSEHFLGGKQVVGGILIRKLWQSTVVNLQGPKEGTRLPSHTG